METRMVAADYRLQQWFKTVQERETSGLTIKEYCKGTGLREHQYYYMLKKVRESVCSELIISNRNNTDLTITSSNDKNSVVWAEVETKGYSGSTTPAGQGNIKITREDWMVTIESGIDTELLIEALKAVKRVCC